ncbi:tyrosine-type recombinase/integrase [Micromonospora sp. LOL_021]|uniref:tyrosine-type recombinase/integrase n=1 Tax=Micromonospora sp. LOL_021 TaxID=3345417 RepID=UPI003A8B6171
MTALAPLLQAFFTDRLMTQYGASPHTIASYRDTFRLLLAHVHQQTGTLPARLDLADLDATTIGGFLHDLETVRGNSPATRNTRLAAIHSLFRYASLRAPEHAHLISRVLAIQTKRTTTTIMTFLNDTELDALLTAPDQSTWHGRRDHALLVLAAQTGLRVAELTALTIADTHLGVGAHVYCHGKGRKDRCTPLTLHTVGVLTGWLGARRPADTEPLFATRRGTPLSHDAVTHLVAKHSAVAAHTCPSLHVKHVTPHTLRHTAAMRLLHAGVDTTVIALWLGHESPSTTRIYLHADMALKEQAIARTTPPDTEAGRYQATDDLLTFLDQL